MVIKVGNGHGDLSSNPEQGCANTLQKDMYPTILPPVIDKL